MAEIKKDLFLARSRLLSARRRMEKNSNHDYNRVILTDVISKINSIMGDLKRAEDKK